MYLFCVQNKYIVSIKMLQSEHSRCLGSLPRSPCTPRAGGIPEKRPPPRASAQAHSAPCRRPLPVLQVRTCVCGRPGLELVLHPRFRSPASSCPSASSPPAAHEPTSPVVHAALRGRRPLVWSQRSSPGRKVGKLPPAAPEAHQQAVATAPGPHHPRPGPGGCWLGGPCLPPTTPCVHPGCPMQGPGARSYREPGLLSVPGPEAWGRGAQPRRRRSARGLRRARRWEVTTVGMLGTGVLRRGTGPGAKG